MKSAVIFTDERCSLTREQKEILNTQYVQWEVQPVQKDLPMEVVQNLAQMFFSTGGVREGWDAIFTDNPNPALLKRLAYADGAWAQEYALNYRPHELYVGQVRVFYNGQLI